MLELRTVEVQGLAFEVLTDGASVWVPMKRVCLRLGLPWDGQRQRIKRSPELMRQSRLMTFDTDGGPQTMRCLSAQAIAILLIGLNPSRFPEPLRASVERLRLITAKQIEAAAAK